MENDWEIAIDALSDITVISNPNNEPVSINGELGELKCIGIGTDAAVFQSPKVPAYAYKLYAKDKLDKVKMEAEVYRKIGDSPYFSTCFASSDTYLVLSYEEGNTLFDCILQGIHIPQQVIKDVEEAREYVRSKGLYPSDMHLKNILLQDGRAKILDVSEYAIPENDYRWEHLKEGYEKYYHLIDGHPVPFWVVETIRKWYHKRNKYFSSFDEFIQFVIRTFEKYRKK